MITVSVHRSFEKGLKSCPQHVRKKVVQFLLVLQDTPSTEEMKQVRSIEPLTNHKRWYKIRFGDCRLGLYIDDAQNAVTIRAIGPRGDFYKHFPPKS